MINSLRRLFKEMWCEHTWRYYTFVAKGVLIRREECSKCGKVKNP